MAAKVSLPRASDELAELAPVMGHLVATHGPVRLGRPERAGERFQSLANAIVFQQLAGKAAQSIWNRVVALTPDGFTPEAVLALSDDELRSAGLSGSKARSVRDLAEKVASGEVKLDHLGRWPDEAIEEELVRVRGIGPWTAHMFLIFNLRRLDVWPTGDYGVRMGYARAYALDEPPTPKELGPLGDRFRPYRSLAAWYCWRAVETVTPG